MGSAFIYILLACVFTYTCTYVLSCGGCSLTLHMELVSSEPEAITLEAVCVFAERAKVTYRTLARFWKLKKRSALKVKRVPGLNKRIFILALRLELKALRKMLELTEDFKDFQAFERCCTSTWRHRRRRVPKPICLGAKLWFQSGQAPIPPIKNTYTLNGPGRRLQMYPKALQLGHDNKGDMGMFCKLNTDARAPQGLPH